MNIKKDTIQTFADNITGLGDAVRRYEENKTANNEARMYREKRYIAGFVLFYACQEGISNGQALTLLMDLATSLFDSERAIVEGLFNY